MRNVESVKTCDMIPLAIPDELLEDDRRAAIKAKARMLAIKARKQAEHDRLRAAHQLERQWPLLERRPEDEFNRMSFTAVRGKDDMSRRDFWVTPEPRTYGEGNDVGRKFADEFISFSLDNPGHALLYTIVRDMDFTDAARKGILAGFLWRIEQLAIRGALA